MKKQFISDTQTLLELHYSNPSFDYSALCEALGLSRSQVYRKFQEHDLGSPSSYIRSFRLQKGKTLLLETDLTINEIAHQIGYTSYNHFTNSFRTAYECSPKEFKEKKGL